MNDIVKAEDFGINITEAQQMTSALDTTLTERELFKQEYLKVISMEVTPQTIPIFKALRLKIVKNRTQGIEKWHKTQKEFFLTGGRFVDAIKNKEIIVNQDWESKLLEAEKHFENIEKERLEKLQLDRMAILFPYVDEDFDRDLTKFEEDEFNVLLDTKRKAFEEKVVAEAQTVKDRIAKEEAEKLTREEMEKENVRLRKEAETKARLEAEQKKINDSRIEELQPYIVFIRDYNGMITADEKEYQKQLADVKKAKNDQDIYNMQQADIKVKEEALLAEKTRLQELTLKKQLSVTAKLEAELKAKKEAEEKEVAEKEAQLQAELSKGDEAKMKDLLLDLEKLKTKYAFKSVKNQKIYSSTSKLLDKVIGYINEKK